MSLVFSFHKIDLLLGIVLLSALLNPISWTQLNIM